MRLVAPVPASAGCNVNVTGKPECTPTPLSAVWSRSVVCLATFILPSRSSPQPRVSTGRGGLDGQATSVAILPSVKLYITAGKVSAALSPDKNPLAVRSLPVVRPNSNSRFFTDCYHQAAAIKPADRRKTSMRGIVLACWGGATRPRGGRPAIPISSGKGVHASFNLAFSSVP